MVIRSFVHRFIGSALVFSALAVVGCAAPVILNGGFPDKQTLEVKEAYVMKESDGGKLDPANLAIEGQRYAHDKIAYDRMEEGYYQWGAKLYEMGFRDEFYVRDLAPKAMHHDLLNTYDHAVASGFDDAEAHDPSKKK